MQHINMVDEPISRSYSSIAVKKGNDLLLADINNALFDVRNDGTYDKIVDKWRGKEIVFKTREQLERQTLYWTIASVSVALIFSVVGIAAQAREIRRRRRSEEELRKSRATLNMILDTVPQSIFWKDVDGRYLGCNRLFAAAAGVEHPADIVGKADYDLPWTTEDADANRADDREVLETNTPKYNIVETLRQANGSRIWIETTKLPLVDKKSQPFAVLGVYTDITSRKKADEALKENHVFLKNLGRIDDVIRKASDMEQMMRDSLEVVLDVMQADRAWIVYPCDVDTEFRSVPWTHPAGMAAGGASKRFSSSHPQTGGLAHFLAAAEPTSWRPGGELPLEPSRGKGLASNPFPPSRFFPRSTNPGCSGCPVFWERVWSRGTGGFQAMGRPHPGGLEHAFIIVRLRESEEKFRTLPISPMTGLLVAR
jgi:PAS domain S-box-containing protein